MENDRFPRIIKLSTVSILIVISLMTACYDAYIYSSSTLTSTLISPTNSIMFETEVFQKTPTTYLPLTYKRECIGISYHLNILDDSYAAILGLGSTNTTMYYPNTGFVESIIDDFNDINYFAISPNGVWMSYRLTEMDPASKKLKSKRLIVTSKSDNKTNIFPWDDNWVYMYWINNEELLITSIENESIILTMFNPFTKNKNTLSTSFPEQTIGSDISFWMRTGDFRFNPNVTFVIYRGYDTSNNYTLYSLTENRIKARIHSYETQSNIPVWSFDGNNVAIALGKLINNKIIEDLYLYSKDGISEKVTDFVSEGFQYVNIGFISWSPDDRFLAFWVKKDQDTNYSLFVYDVENDLLKDYCIMGDFGGIFQLVIGISDHFTSPLWSPDGNNILISRRDEDNVLNTVLFSLPQKKAKIIATEIWPIGWIKIHP